MPHEFPKEIIPSDASRNPEFLNERFRSLAAELSVGLNEHDLAAGIIPDISKVVEGAATDLAVSRISADPDLTTLAYFAYRPKEDPGNSVSIVDSPSWQEITSVEISTGEDDLYIVGCLTYAAGFDETMEDINPVRAQFALEVDGNIQQDTITGHLDLTQTVATQTYKVDRGTTPYTEWDHRHIRRLDDVVGLNKNAGSVRIIFSISVVEGSHTVRLMGRRVPRNEHILDASIGPPITSAQEYLAYQARTDLYVKSDYEASLLNIFSHVLAAIRIGGWQQAGSTARNDFAPPDIEDGDTLTTAKLGANRIVAATDALNALRPGDLARGSLRAEHLPSLVEPETAHQAEDTSGYTVTSEYAGFGLLGDNVLQGNWSIDASQDGIILILADVEVQDLNVAAGYNRDSALGIFRLVVETGAGFHYLDGTEVYVSSDVLTPKDPLELGAAGPKYIIGELGDVHDNVSLAWVGRGSELPDNVLSVRVYAQVWDTVSGAASTPSMEIQRRSLSLVQFRR